MSNQQPGTSQTGGSVFAEPPDRCLIASYECFSDAEQAVASLPDENFPQGRGSIVGHGVQFAEQTVGKFSYRTAEGGRRDFSAVETTMQPTWFKVRLFQQHPNAQERGVVG